MDLLTLVFLSWLFDKKCEHKKDENETKNGEATILLGSILLLLGLAPFWIGFLIPFIPNMLEDIVFFLLGKSYITFSKLTAYGISSVMWGMLLFFLQRTVSSPIAKKFLSIHSIFFLLIGIGMLVYSIISVK